MSLCVYGYDGHSFYNIPSRRRRYQHRYDCKGLDHDSSPGHLDICSHWVWFKAVTSIQFELLTCCSLASGSFMLFFGKTADLIGRKLQLLAGMAFLSVTSLATAFVSSPIGLNVLCGFLGLGTAVISPPAVGTLFATYPEGQRRNKATGALGCGNPIGFILGSVSSGIITKYFSWRASFIVVAIFFAIMTVSSFWTMPPTPRAGSLGSEAKQFDYLGTGLTILGFALVSAALTFVSLLFPCSCTNIVPEKPQNSAGNPSKLL
jgi:MFS family permease